MEKEQYNQLKEKYTAKIQQDKQETLVYLKEIPKLLVQIVGWSVLCVVYCTYTKIKSLFRKPIRHIVLVNHSKFRV